MQEIPEINVHFYGVRQAPAIIFLHGFMGAADDWLEVVNQLNSEFRLVLIDLPGHGVQPKVNIATNWSMENTARAVINFLENAGESPSFIVGYSMGGRLALYLALHYPRYFKKVILEGASPGLRDPEARRQRREQDEVLAQQLESGDFEAFVRKWYRQPLFQSLQGNKRFSAMFNRRLRNNPLWLTKVLREMGTGSQPSQWELLSRVKIPILLVVGEKDSKFCSIAGEMCKASNLIQMEIVPGCGHNVHLEMPQLFAEQVKAFFSGG